MPRPPAIPTAPDEGLRTDLAPSDSEELAPEVRDMASQEIDFPDQPPEIAQPAIRTSPGGPQASRGISQAATPREIDFPDKAPQLEQVYQQVAHLDPERASQVIQFAKAINQPEAYVDKNLDSVKRVAQAPDTSFFSELEKQYPGTSKFLADPKNMVVAHDDLPNLAAHEGLVQDVKTAHGFIDAFKAGLEGSLPGLILREKMPDLQLATQKDQTWSEYLGAQVGGLAGDLPVMAAAGLGSTPAVGPFAGTVASFALPAAAKQAVIGYLQNGDVKSAGDLLGRLYDNYKEAGKQGLVGTLATLAGIPGAKLAGTPGKLAAEALTMPTVASAEEGKLPTLKDVVGGALVMGGLHGLGVGLEGLGSRYAADKSAESHDFYDQFGQLAEQSKLRERSPEQYAEHIESLVQRTPVESAYIPAQEFERYFQGKNLNPDAVAEQLGVTDSLNEARTRGEDAEVQIPFSKYVQAFAGTEHWAGLKPDVKFDADELTPRQNQESEAPTKELTQAAESDAQKRTQFFQSLDPEQMLNDPRLTRAESLSDPQALSEVVQSKERAEALEQHLSEIAESSADPLQREHAATTLETLQKIKDSLPSERSPEDASADRIHKEIDAQLKDAGLSPEKARENANVLASFYRVRGERMGQDPYALYQERPIRVQRAEEATGEFHQLGNEPARPIEQDLATRRSERNLPAQVPVTSLETDRSFEGREPNEIRKLSLEDAKSAPRGKVVNKAEGWDVTLSGEGLKKSANYAKRPEQAVGLKNIRPLIENAQYVRSEQRPGGIMHDYLYAPFEHDGRDYLAKIVVENVPADPRRNVEAHRKFYSLHVQEIKSPAEGRTIGLPTPAEAGSSPDGQPLDGSASSRPSSAAEAAEPVTSGRAIPLQDFLGRINQARETTKLFQSKPTAPPFYSKLTRTIEEKMGNSATADQVRGIIKEIKPEERKWLGIDEFLKGKEKVSKPELLEFLRANQLEVHEVTKGGEHEELEVREADDGTFYVENLQGRNVLEGVTQSEAEDFAEKQTGATKFERYTLPGGENYREVLFTLPSDRAARQTEYNRLVESGVPLMEAHRRVDEGANPEYRSSHWDEPNVLAHVRLNDRTDADSKKVLFVEEIQSDLHQDGRKKGYRGEPPPGVRIEEEPNPNLGKFRAVDEKSGELLAHGDTREAAIEHIGGGGAQPPDMPFRKTWHEFALKRILRMAAEGGYDRVSWTTGEQQAERYDLSKKIDRVELMDLKPANGEGLELVAYDKDDHAVMRENVSSPAEAEKFIGKDAAQKLESAQYVENEQGMPVKTLSGVDLKVGGSGMKGFYDKILPDFANKFGKKYGAKVVETQLRGTEDAESRYGVRGSGDEWRVIDTRSSPPTTVDYFDSKEDALAKLEELVGEPTDTKVRSLDITPALKDAALNEGFSLFQGDNEHLGSITIGERQISIDLLKRANASTIIHEFGHAFLDIMARDAAKEDAPEEVKRDFQAVLKYLGVNSYDEVQTEHHENFAKAFEAYIAEGKAPSEGLRPAFDRFKDWMLSVYTDIKKQLGIELSPEIRGVFDRMLATKEEIEQAQASIGQREELIKGLPPEVARRLSDLEARARSQAESTLLKEQMKEVTAEHKEFLEKERERVTKEAQKEVRQIPVFKASDELRNAIGARRTAARLAHQLLEGELKTHESAAFEVAAERNGFASGEELAREILIADSNGGYDAEVKERVDMGMQKHAALMDTDAIRQKALEAVHSNRSTELLALERQTLQDLIKTANTRVEASRRNRIEAKTEADAAKNEAQSIISKKAVKDVNPGPYLTGERNAAVRVSKALAKGDFEAAAKAKQEQLVNHALAREAMRAQKEAQKTVEFLTDKAKEGRDFTKMPYAFARQVDQILTRFGFKDATPEDLSTLSQIAEHMLRQGEDAHTIADATGLKETPSGAWAFETLPDFVQRQNENYFGIQLPDVVMGSDKPFRSISTTELSDLKDAVKTLTTLGKNRDRFLEAFNTSDINEAGKQFAASVEENVGHPEARNLRLGTSRTTPAEKILGTLSDIPKVLARWMDTMLTTCHKLDGLKSDGPAKEFIYRRMSDAEGRRLARTRQEMEALDVVFAKHFQKGELDDYKNTSVKVNGNNVTKEELLAMALNWGNAGNRDRITRGFGMTESEIEQLLFKNLSKRDFDFAQGVWNYLEKFKPEIKKLEMEVNGVEPKFVDPSPVVTPWGAYDGGYYPISYDPERSASAYRYTEQTTALYKQFGAAKAQTEQGHVVARVNSLKRPVSLSLDVLTNHIEDVIHDLEYRKPVIDVARFLIQKDAKSALLNSLGTRGYNAINDWLKAVASGPSEPLHFGEGAARWLRFRTTMFYMGYRLASVPKIAIENLNNISNELGVADAARAMKDYYMGESGLHELVVSKSEFMRQRAEHLDRDMSDVYDKYSGKEGLLAQSAKFAFWTHAILDQGVSFPLWTHVYKEAMAHEENEKAAVQKADEAVKRSFMTGGTVDQAAIMRGSETQKAFTVALGYQSMMWNRYSQSLFATGQALRQGAYADAAMIAARAHFYSFVMPAAIAVLAHEMVRNSQRPATGDDEKKRILGDSLKELTPLKFIPVARDVFPYFIDKSLGTHGSDLQVTPLERAAQTILEPAADAFHSSLTGQPLGPRFGEKITNAASLLAPVPKTVNDIVFNFLDWQKDHGALTWKDFVSRKSH